MSVILNGECLAVGEPMATSTPVPPMLIPSLCITATGWEEGRVERMEDELNKLREELAQVKRQLAVEKSTVSQLKEVVEKVGDESRQREEARKELAKELIVVEVRGMRELEMEKVKVTDLQKENERLLQNVVSARRYLPIQRGVVDERYYASTEEVLQELILCHLERQNVSETTINIDADGYAAMTVLLLNGSEYLRSEMLTSNGVCLTFGRAFPENKWKGDHSGHPLGFGALTIINRGKTLPLPESFTKVVRNSLHLIRHVNLVNLCDVGPLTRALRRAHVDYNNM